MFSCLVCCDRVTGGELFDDIVAREFYSEADARYIYFILKIFHQHGHCQVYIFFCV